MIHDIVVNKWGYKLFFVESICDDPTIIEQNIMVCMTVPHWYSTISSFHNNFIVGGEGEQPGLYKHGH